MNEPALVDIVHELGVGRVQRAGNRAGALAFGFLAQVDQRDVGPADQRLRLRGGLRPAAARDLLLVQALVDVGGHRHIHHLRVGQVEARHQLGVFLGVAHLKARIEAP